MCKVCNAMREQEIETAGMRQRKQQPLSDLKPDANNNGRKGHTGETEQMKKIIRKRKGTVPEEQRHPNGA